MTSHRIYDRVVVDTDVFSYLLRRDPKGDFFEPYLVSATLAVSFMTVAELYYGAYWARWGSRRIEQLEQALSGYTVLPYDVAVCQRWAQTRALSQRGGITVSFADLWHAACAMVHDCALATNNIRHFNHIDGLNVIGPGPGTGQDPI